MTRQPAHLRRRNKIAGQFSARLIEMLESPAYRVLSLSAHRVLARLEIELARHGGHDNGRLPVTFNDFVNYGIDRGAVAAAIREVEALGFIRVSERGCAGNAEFRAPNKFLLTYPPSINVPPSNDWKQIKTIEEALEIARAARAPIRKRRPQKNRIPVGEKNNFSRENPDRKAKSPVWETPTTAMVGKPTLLSISRGGATPAPASTLISSEISGCDSGGRNSRRTKLKTQSPKAACNGGLPSYASTTDLPPECGRNLASTKLNID
jgi:hypothetical protein